MSRRCRTGVRVPDASNPDGYHFAECGKPTTQTASVGLAVCHYCDEHAASARRFVERQGQSSIVAIPAEDGGRMKAATAP